MTKLTLDIHLDNGLHLGGLGTADVARRLVDQRAGRRDTKIQTIERRLGYGHRRPLTDQELQAVVDQAADLALEEETA
jgi:hypothetical protein